MPSFLENIFRRQIATNACPGEIRYDTTWCEAKITSSGAHLSAQDPKSAETRRNALCGACTSRRLERCRRLKRYVLNARSACHHSMHHSCLAHLLTPLRPQSSNECGRVRHSRKVDDLHTVTLQALIHALLAYNHSPLYSVTTVVSCIVTLLQRL